MAKDERTINVECAGVGAFEGKSRAGASEFIVVAIQANTTNRYVEATAFLNGVQIGKISAADNYAANVISSGTQMMTLPIPPGTSWRVSWNVANHNQEVKIWRVYA